MLNHESLFARPQLVRNEVYEHLKLEILNGTLKPGVKLAEIPLSERLGVSRTPVREAVQRLAQDGLVLIEANKGAKVRGISLAEIEEIYAVREVLDGLAAKLAAKHRSHKDLRAMQNALQKLEQASRTAYTEQVSADLEFHNAIASASGNSTLETTLKSLAQSVARVKLLTRETNQNQSTYNAHHAILSAIENKDDSLAEKNAREHVRAFQEMLTTQLTTRGEV
jgi:DNA-binding GntR family transcriptional regulator